MQVSCRDGPGAGESGGVDVGRRHGTHSVHDGRAMALEGSDQTTLRVSRGTELRAVVWVGGLEYAVSALRGVQEGDHQAVLGLQ